MRDVDKQKVYSAEGMWRFRDDRTSELVTIDEANYMLLILAAEFDVNPPRAKINPRLRRYSGWWRPNGTIEFSAGGISVKTVLHEFAHHISPHDREGHSPEFCRAMLSVVDAWFCDDRATDMLRSLYIRAGIDLDESTEERRARKLAAAEKRMKRSQERVGETGTGWVVAFDDSNGGYLQENDYMTYSIGMAKVWRRQSAAQKRADSYRSGYLVEVDCTWIHDRYQGYGGGHRWQATGER